MTINVKCSDTLRTIVSESDIFCITDAEVRRHGDQKGLETLVVHAVNDEY